MNIKRSFLWIFLFFSITSFAIGDSSPTAVLQQVSNTLINKLKAEKLVLKKNPTEVYKLVRVYLLPHVDMNLLSHAVLGNEWKKATSQQKSLFKERFTTIIIRTYSSALAAYTNETIKFLPIRDGYEGKRTVRVDSRIIRQDGPSIPVSYRLIKRGQTWKVYDLIVEGVSLVQSYRSQFSSILAQGGMPTLLDKMASHNAKR